MNPNEPIALIGIGCRYPGDAAGPEAFWKLLAEGVDAITEVPGDRWSIAKYYHPDPGLPGKTNSRWGGFLEKFDQFDPGFFGISPREAQFMDPQQRLLLETAWESLEDAGICLPAGQGSKTGVFVGLSTFDYWRIQAGDHDKTTIETHSTTGTVLSIAANRISYLLNLQGPSLVVDTACSSSLVALHLACQSLRRGECETALAGGANFILNPETFIGFSRMGMLSPDGRCKAFDVRGNGFVRGEGAGVVVLKPLTAAQEAGDRVYAVIRATAVNQDGRTTSLTVPGADAQRRLIREACRESGIAPGEVDYVEAHGTGTAVGDPIEAGAIGEVIGQNRTGTPCLLGSVKTNIGHLEAGSGIAGLIKTALSLHHGAIPASLHFEQPHPDINFTTLNLRVPVALEPLPRKDAIAAINSFGFGGTNAHAILQAVPPPPAPQCGDAPDLLVLSARDPDRLESLARHYAQNLKTNPGSLRDLCFTAGTRRPHEPSRLAVAGCSKTEITEKLEAFLAGETRPGLAVGQAEERRGTVFVFSGQGPQWWAMGRELLTSHHGFRETIAECDALFRSWGGWSLWDELTREESASRMDHPSIAQPALFALQLGLVAWWREHGVLPQACIGHSVGEAAAAHVSGALDLPSAARVIFERGRCMEKARPNGRMLAVAVSPEMAGPWLAGLRRKVEIGAINSPQSLTLSGDATALAEIAKRLESANIWCRFLRVNYAFHSSHMDPVRKEFLAALRALVPQSPAMPLCSTVTGALVEGATLNADYWWRNVREPVRFADGIHTLAGQGRTTFVEIGPHPALSSALSENLKAAGVPGVITHSLRRGEPEEVTLLGALGTLHTRGLPISWPTGGRVVSLPGPAWRHARYWHEAAECLTSRLGPASRPFLGHRLNASAAQWGFPVHLELLSFLKDHRLDQRVIFPASGYVEMALSAAEQLFGSVPVVVEDLMFDRALFLPEEGPAARLEIHVEEDGSFFFHSQSDAGARWTAHGSGKIRPLRESHPPERIPLADIQSRCGQETTGAVWYEIFRRKGLAYGETFQGMRRVWHRHGEAVGEIAMSHREAGCLFHPAPLDSCFQILLAALPEGSSSPCTYLPAQIGRVRFYGTPGNPLWSHVKVTHQNEREVAATIRIFNGDGTLVALIEDFRCAAIHRHQAKDSPSELLYEVSWEEAAPDAAPSPQGSWLLIGSETDWIRAVATALPPEGEPCEIIASPAELDACLADPRRGGHIVYFPQSPWENEADSTESCCGHLLDIVQKISAWGGGRRLSVVTRNAQPVETARVAPSHSALLGLCRVIQSEMPALQCQLVDVGGCGDSSALAEELCRGGQEEIALRGTRRLIPRLHQATPSPRLLDSRRVPFRLETAKPGVLEHLVFRPKARSAPGPDEVEIEVAAAALNFRDVMKALGIYPIEHAFDLLLGDECAGRVVRAGEKSGFAVGDDVLALSQGGFSQYLTVSSVSVMRKPDTLTFSEAVTIPVAFLTAFYALHHLARMEAGERVLIHAAAGGVGLAALQIARNAGAEIFATAGSDEKRALVRSLGATHVMDSRSVEFADAVMAATHGRGVDIVLNSLAGEAIPKSLSVLAPYGRFLEIGKRDIYANSRIGLRPFRRNLSFFAIDLNQVMRDRPAFIQNITREILARFGAGDLSPLPHTVSPLAHAVETFREMASGRHQGKLVFTFADPVPVQAPEGPLQLQPDATYLLSGGTSGFGLATAEWMIAQGAKHLVLLGSSEPSALAAQAHFAQPTFSGVEVLARAVDVANPAALNDLMAHIAHSLPPLRGVIHAAMRMDDGLLPQLNTDRFRAVLNPKARGAWNLHAATRNQPLDFFVMFSSVSSLIGNPGQGNYAAANAFLDGLAHHRRSLGLPALTINWGHLGGAGYVSRNSQIGDHLRRLGIPELPAADALRKLGRLLRADATQIAVMRMDWTRWAEAHPHRTSLPFFQAVLPTDSSRTHGSGSDSFLQSFRAASDTARLALLESFLAGNAAKVLGMTPSAVATNRPLGEMGLDSLMSVELVNRLETALQARVPVEKITPDASIHSLAEILKDLLASPPAQDAR